MESAVCDLGWFGAFSVCQDRSSPWNNFCGICPEESCHRIMEPTQLEQVEMRMVHKAKRTTLLVGTDCLHQKNRETGVNQPLSTANIPSHHLNCSLIYADVHWVFIKHLLCARRHGVPLWVKARGRLSSGSAESHVHSGKASTMSPPQSKGPHGFSAPWLPQEIYQAPLSLQNEDSHCLSVSGLQGGCSGLWKVTGDSNGCWWLPLRTEEDTGCHGGSGCWATPFA